MPKNSPKPLVRLPFTVYRIFPDESSEDKIKFSKLINALESAENSNEGVLDLSFERFGRLVNSSDVPKNIAHIEIKYIRDFFFDQYWDHLRIISFANQNLSCFEINIIMMSIIHDRRGGTTLPAEAPIIKQLSYIDISGNDVLSETLEFFSLALVDPKRPEKTISGMLQVDQLNITNCNIKSDDENVALLRDLNVTVILEEDSAGLASVLGEEQDFFLMLILPCF